MLVSDCVIVYVVVFLSEGVEFVVICVHVGGEFVDVELIVVELTVVSEGDVVCVFVIVCVECEYGVFEVLFDVFVSVFF